MAIQTIKATMQMRRGAEENFDPDQMTAGEWAVSTDSKKVWMCFAPGIVRRMATYEAFEEDMLEIQQILATCQDIQTAVKAFEQLALQHKNAADASAANAKNSETNAKASETAAKNYQIAAKTSETNARSSEENALASENSASASANTASTKASESATSATNAANSATIATQKANDASSSANNAENSASIATQKAIDATASAEESEDYSKMSKSWAIGEGEMREDESVNNSKYYAEQAAKLVDAAGSGGLIPMGTVSFENLPTSNIKNGWMYNISNDFTSDSRFEDGGNIYYKAGANVYYTAGEKWDVLTGIQVTGVKGNSETNYRTGNVNITKANVGLGNVPDVSTNDQTPTFTQAATRENIASGNKMSVILGKIMKWYSDLKAVAFSGSYNDLSNKPTIPSVGNGTLTIQKNGANVQTFTANQGTNATANITVPTKASDIGAVATTKVLTTKEQIDANTDTSNVAGATAVKSMISEINSNLENKIWYNNASVPLKIQLVSGLSITAQAGETTSVPFSLNDENISAIFFSYQANVPSVFSMWYAGGKIYIYSNAFSGPIYYNAIVLIA